MERGRAGHRFPRWLSGLTSVRLAFARESLHNSAQQLDQTLYVDETSKPCSHRIWTCDQAQAQVSGLDESGSAVG